MHAFDNTFKKSNVETYTSTKLLCTFTHNLLVYYSLPPITTNLHREGERSPGTALSYQFIQAQITWVGHSVSRNPGALGTTSSFLEQHILAWEACSMWLRRACMYMYMYEEVLPQIQEGGMILTIHKTKYSVPNMDLWETNSDRGLVWPTPWQWEKQCHNVITYKQALKECKVSTSTRANTHGHLYCKDVCTRPAGQWEQTHALLEKPGLPVAAWYPLTSL